MKEDTRLTCKGRDPASNHGIINPPVYHASTVIFPTVQELRNYEQHKIRYGRSGTPTSFALEELVCDLEGGYGAKLTPSGLNAIATALLCYTAAGDHILLADSVYHPTKGFCADVLSRFNIEITYYDPLIGGDIKQLIKPNTKLIFTESPGSLTFEVQDIPAIAEAAHARDCIVMLDNTWSAGVYFKPFAHGVDVSIQAATKYIGGHADAMMGVIIANQQHWPVLEKGHRRLGVCAAPDDIYLTLRGARSLKVRLAQHQKNALELAHWLSTRPEVARIIHPALPGCPGHDIWRRDFTGSSGLFSIVLNPYDRKKTDAMLNSLKLFAMGYSWGGYESLIVPFNPKATREHIDWPDKGQALRIHAGLEDIEDLKADLEAGFGHL